MDISSFESLPANIPPRSAVTASVMLELVVSAHQEPAAVLRAICERARRYCVEAAPLDSRNLLRVAVALRGDRVDTDAAADAITDWWLAVRFRDAGL